MDCIHQIKINQSGLCPECQEEYDYDPQSYIEYGDHPEGLKNWNHLLDEMINHAQEHLMNE